MNNFRRIILDDKSDDNVNETYEFDYTGTMQSITLSPGTYKLLCWGAQGNSNKKYVPINGVTLSSYKGGLGGYSYGILILTEETTLYIHVGGTNGYNGGGGRTDTGKNLLNENGYYWSYGNGGGASDIRTNVDSLYARIIVAGGGAGAVRNVYLVPEDGSGTKTYVGGNGSAGGGIQGKGTAGGTQSKAGTGGGFGYGCSNNTSNNGPSGGGGGGWYGGGYGTAIGVNNSRNDGGGSGFVNVAENATYRPSTYIGLELEKGITINGTKKFESPSGNFESGHSGNGYIKITLFNMKELTPNTEEFVDLGLPSRLKWAKGNLCKDDQGNYYIGESTDEGVYVSWGNIDGYNSEERYNFTSINYDSTPGKLLNSNISPTDDLYDICYARLGEPWHLPTKEQFQELFDNTDFVFTTINGVNGCIFMKKSDYRISIFLPISGYYSGTTLSNGGRYWTSTYSGYNNVYYANFNSNVDYNGELAIPSIVYSSKYYGFTVRPVR